MPNRRGDRLMAAERAPERLAALQRRFADHIRDPQRCPAPEGIEERRLAIYRRLFFNNLSSLFGNNFASAKRLLPEADWQRLIRAFLVEHRARTPLFPEIGGEFVQFLAEHPEHYSERWPWLAELCHWRFLITTVRNHKAEPADCAAEPQADLLATRPQLNPTLALGAYRWPVHTIREGALPQHEAPCLLAAWRRRDDGIGRLQINAVTARLLELLQEHPDQNGLMLLKGLAEELNHPAPETLVEHGRRLLQDLCQRELVLGGKT